jgi:predicted PurR-regulated permease PerM
MDIVELAKTLKDNWGLLVTVFALGSAWYQGKVWFNKFNDTLDSTSEQIAELKKSLQELTEKVEALHINVGDTQEDVKKILSVQHFQEVKLAILAGKKEQ